MKKLLALISLVAIFSLIAAGCAVPPGSTITPPGPGATPTQGATSPGPGVTTPPTAIPAGLGKLEVRVTDAPPKEEVTAIVVTAAKLEVHWLPPAPTQTPTGTPPTQSPSPSPTATQTPTAPPGKWITIDIPENCRTFDLIKIKGVEQTLGTGQLAAGKYTQVRLTVADIKVGLDNGDPKPAEVPSGVLKFVRPFTIEDGKTTVIVLDFDAEKSVNIVGKDRIMVKPVVKLTVKSDKPGKEPTENDCQKIARDFVKDEPTFVFDGMPETLKLVETVKLTEPYAWQFTFEFQSRHAGYGDRTGQTLLQVITPHRAVIQVINGEITSAIMDGKWDMLRQALIEPTPTPT